MMNKADWQAVLPAITTPFGADMSVDIAFLRRHVAWLVENGCRGIVTPGSLGEGGTLTAGEKVAIWTRKKAPAMASQRPSPRRGRAVTPLSAHQAQTPRAAMAKRMPAAPMGGKPCPDRDGISPRAILRTVGLVPQKSVIITDFLVMKATIYI